ncbi:MAG: uracil-DNA glycosylase [Deltaproteobacteria bacterium]|nr:uracil-DNA glycosylase [Deltaproteobacteria bacterium]
MASVQELKLELLEIVRALKAYVQTYPQSCGESPEEDRVSESQPFVSFTEEEKTVSDQNHILTLEMIHAEMGDCQRCPLGRSRTHLVFGEGNPQAELVFVGEAPGGDEDRLGRPFVGRAGQLLTKIVAAMGLTRRDVYICNILKCRPPGNRNPQPDEIAACEPFLIKQLQAIQPKIICALGTFAAKTLLKTDVPISVLRGRYHDYHDISLMPTYHPAYLLRNPGAKKLVWEDVQVIMKDLGLKKKDKSDIS